MKTVTKTAKEMMTNKYVLYTLLLLAILNVLAFLITNNFISLAVFALVGLLTTYFTKNMSVVLLVSLVVSSFLHISKVSVESMTNKKGGDADGAETDADEADEADEADMDSDNEEKEGEGAKGKDVKGHMETDAPMIKNKKHKLNHQATVQESYNNIHSILGSKNFKKMTRDTNKLLEQQNKLTESLNNMAPILKSAESMLGKFDMDKMTGMLDSLSMGGKKKKN